MYRRVSEHALVFIYLYMYVCTYVLGNCLLTRDKMPKKRIFLSFTLQFSSNIDIPSWVEDIDKSRKCLSNCTSNKSISASWWFTLPWPHARLYDLMRAERPRKMLGERRVQVAYVTRHGHDVLRTHWFRMMANFSGNAKDEDVELAGWRRTNNSCLLLEDGRAKTRRRGAWRNHSGTGIFLFTGKAGFQAVLLMEVLSGLLSWLYSLFFRCHNNVRNRMLRCKQLFHEESW